MNPWIKEIDDYLQKKIEELDKLPETEEIKEAKAYIRSLKPYSKSTAHFEPKH